MADMLIYAWKPCHRTIVAPAAALSWLAVLPSGAAHAQDWVWGNREMAKTAAMHDIAVIQASIGDFQGAKRTVSQIGEEGEKIPAEVTVVSFCNGQPIYHCPAAGCGCPSSMAATAPAATPGWGVRDPHGTQYFLALDRAPIVCHPSCRPICRQSTWIPIRVTASWSTLPMSGTPMARA